MGLGVDTPFWVFLLIVSSHFALLFCGRCSCSPDDVTSWTTVRDESTCRLGCAARLTLFRLHHRRAGSSTTCTTRRHTWLSRGSRRSHTASATPSSALWCARGRRSSLSAAVGVERARSHRCGRHSLQVILAGIAVFRNPIPPLNAAASAVAIAGTWFYSRAEMVSTACPAHSSSDGLGGLQSAPPEGHGPRRRLPTRPRRRRRTPRTEERARASTPSPLH